MSNLNFDGYEGQLVKQADVTLLQYPLEVAMPATVAKVISTTTYLAPIQTDLP